MASVIFRIKSPIPWLMGLGGVFNLPDVFYDIKSTIITDIKNEKTLAPHLNQFLTTHRDKGIFIFGDPITLEVEISKNDKADEAPINFGYYCQKVREATEKHRFLSGYTLNEFINNNQVNHFQVFLPLRAKQQAKKQVFYGFTRNYLIGATLVACALILASLLVLGTTPPMAALLLAAVYGGLMAAGYGYLRRLYFNYAAHLYDTKDKIRSIHNPWQQKALEYGAQATDWKGYLLSYSPTRFQSYLYPMTFAAGQENKALVEKEYKKRPKN